MVVTAFVQRFSSNGHFRRIVDLGAGTGGVLMRLASHALALCVEENEQLAKVGHRQYGLPFVRANLSQGIPVRDGSLDLALLLDVLEHVDNDHDLLMKTARLLRPGGEVIVTVPAFRLLWSRHDELHHHKRRYGKEELCAVLRGAGFTCVRVSYYNSFLLPLVFLSRAWERFSVRWATSATDYERAPFLAGLFWWIFTQERHIITRWRFPIGVSLIVLARKSEQL